LSDVDGIYRTKNGNEQARAFPLETRKAYDSVHDLAGGDGRTIHSPFRNYQQLRKRMRGKIYWGYREYTRE